jgi:hypothetical protein
VRRKVLQDYANKVCEIFAGWRIAVAPGDLDRLLEAGTGTVNMNLRTGATCLSGQAVEPLGISRELAAWLAAADRAENDRLPLDQLTEANLAVSFRLSEDQDGRGTIRHLDFQCRSELRTDELSYTGRLDKREVWTRPAPGRPWMVYDT